MGWYRWDDGDLVLDLRVQPRARLNAFVEPIADQYRVKITAPPVDGKANAHLKRFLASTFGVPVRQVELVGGAQSHIKRFRVYDPRRLPPIIAPLPLNEAAQLDSHAPENREKSANDI